MENSRFTDLLKQYKVKMSEGIMPLSDEAVEQVSGGVGGADEATCPCCAGMVGMSRIDNPYGDPFWTCPKCGTNQYFSDAETIEIIHYMEQVNYPGIEYPSWWGSIR